MPTKKPAVKKTATKEKVDKPVVKNLVKSKKEPVVKSKVQLVSFEVACTIPTQSYGNIQPKIVVLAPSIQEAKDTVMPIIEEMYRTYAVRPLLGEQVAPFLGTVTVTEKKVEVPAKAKAPGAPVGEAKVEPVKTPEPVAPAPAPATEPEVAKPLPVQKAEKAISLADNHERLATIAQQINDSVKIEPAYKPDLLVMVTNRKNQLPF
jgi:hypothetical protein